MEQREYEIMYVAEESHWWYQGMAAIARKVIETYYAPGPHLRILDAGCGTGSGMLLLSRYGKVTGLDISPQALRLSRKKNQRDLLRASLMSLPFLGESFDLVTSFDTLYFKEVDDALALQESVRVLIPGGRIVLRVPAFDWLRGIHDAKVATGHRYTLRELSGKMAEKGLEVQFINYVNSFLFPFVLLKRLSEKYLPPQEDSDIAIPLGYLGQVFKGFLILESCLIRKCRFPFGLSIIAVGRKSSE
ncbi:MAG: class I SAM-dependent methyltransferase [Pseudomonadota bacterium]